MIKKFIQFLGIQESKAVPGVTESEHETESVRHIIQSLNALDPAKAHYIALFASILSRVARADLNISEPETRAIEEIVMRVGEIDEKQALLVTEIAKHQNHLLGGVENYLITREFANTATQQQSLELLESLFAVAAAEAGISAEENYEIGRIAEEIGLTRKDFLVVRSKFKEELTVLKDLPSE